MQPSTTNVEQLHIPQASATEAGAKPTTSRPAPLAIVTTVIAHDQITTTAQLVMGGFVQAVQRTWQRTGKGSFSCREPEFIMAEDRLGIELAEFSDSISTPIRVANMLPRNPASTSSPAFKAAMHAIRGLNHD